MVENVCRESKARMWLDRIERFESHLIRTLLYALASCNTAFGTTLGKSAERFDRDVARQLSERPKSRPKMSQGTPWLKPGA